MREGGTDTLGAADHADARVRDTAHVRSRSRVTNSALDGGATIDHRDTLLHCIFDLKNLNSQGLRAIIAARNSSTKRVLGKDLSALLQVESGLKNSVESDVDKVCIGFT